MLEIRPSCEHCNRALPPDSELAMICSYECTFCSDCVSDVLENVCPNCGGGFVPRPVRPAKEWVSGVFLGRHPAVTRVTYKPVDKGAHQKLKEAVGDLAPHQR